MMLDKSDSKEESIRNLYEADNKGNDESLFNYGVELSKESNW